MPSNLDAHRPIRCHQCFLGYAHERQVAAFLSDDGGDNRSVLGAVTVWRMVGELAD